MIENRPSAPRLVAYAVNTPSSSEHRAFVARQIDGSLASLRARDASIDVAVFAYGADRELARIAERHHARVVPCGSYEDGLAQHCSTERASVLAEYPVLHKWLALATLGSTHEVLYVDNDTYFFASPSRLFDAHAARDFTAREEVWSSRSYAGYRADYLDEGRLFALAEREGRRPLPPYNLGAVLLGNGLTQRLGAVLPALLEYVWRFCLGIVRDVAPKDFEGEHQLERLVRDGTSTEGALAYPSSNYWIVEQVALLFALGGIEGLTHDAFPSTDVVQGVEYHFLSKPRTAPGPVPVLAHYFSSNTESFFRWVESHPEITA